MFLLYILQLKKWVRTCSYFAENIHLFDDSDLVGQDSLVIFHGELVASALVVVKSSIFINGQFYRERSSLLHFWVPYFIKHFVFQELAGTHPEVRVEFKHILEDFQDLWSGEWEFLLELNFAGIRAKSVDVVKSRRVGNETGVLRVLVSQDFENHLELVVLRHDVLLLTTGALHLVAW